MVFFLKRFDDRVFEDMFTFLPPPRENFFFLYLFREEETGRSFNVFVDRRGYLAAESFVCEGNSSGNCGVRKEKENTIQVGSECNANVCGTRYNRTMLMS